MTHKADILIAENDYKALYDYMRSISHDAYSAVDFYHEYAVKLPLEYQTDILQSYAEAIRRQAAEAKKRDHYSRVRYHIEKIQEIEPNEALTSSLISEFRDLYRRRPSFMEQLSRIKINKT